MRESRATSDAVDIFTLVNQEPLHDFCDISPSVKFCLIPFEMTHNSSIF